jgi:hypothetical protein
MTRRDGRIDINTVDSEIVIEKLVGNGVQLGWKSKLRIRNHLTDRRINYIRHLYQVGGLKNSWRRHVLAEFFCGTNDQDIAIWQPVQAPIIQISAPPIADVPQVQPIVAPPIIDVPQVQSIVAQPMAYDPQVQSVLILPELVEIQNNTIPNKEKVDPPPNQYLTNISKLFGIFTVKLRCEEDKNKLDQLKNILEDINKEMDVKSVEIYEMKPILELPEKKCPTCLTDFFNIHDKIVTLGCSHIICKDCVMKLSVNNANSECPICRKVFVKQSVNESAWIRDILSKDPIRNKKQELLILIDKKTIIEKEIGEIQKNYDDMVKNYNITDEGILELIKININQNSSLFQRFKEMIKSV